MAIALYRYTSHNLVHCTFVRVVVAFELQLTHYPPATGRQTGRSRSAKTFHWTLLQSGTRRCCKSEEGIKPMWVPCATPWQSQSNVQTNMFDIT